jgi:hypothetical protein
MNMKQLNFAARGDGSHCGLSDWYPENKAALRAALQAHEPFDTGWYASKKAIASARIYSEDGIRIKVEVSVSDDFDTEGLGYSSTDRWDLQAVEDEVSMAWTKAEDAQRDNAVYVGFSVGRDGRWEETLILPAGWDENLQPPGDNYHWWGWQHDETEEGSCVGVPMPDIPLPAVAAFENWAQKWACGQAEGNEFRIGAWSIRPWRDQAPSFEDPSDYQGMGWVGNDGRP